MYKSVCVSEHVIEYVCVHIHFIVFRYFTVPIHYFYSNLKNNSVDVIHDQPFKALHGYRCECYRQVVIQAGYLSVLGHRDNGGLLENVWYYRLRQGEVENVSEDTSQSAHARSARPGNPSDPAAL